jgi:flavin reductase (DIM6/NTAB) family NADH-FMN oxidoreductase RutF
MINLDSLERRYRANLINSLGGFKSICLIGTKNNAGNENLAIFSSLVHIGADPALCGFIVRPSIPPRNTLANILETKFYTINHIHESIINQAHQTSAKYDDDISEFDAVGLHTVYKDDFFAPFVKESNIKFACEFIQKIDIEINGTSLIIGKIIDIIVPNEIIENDGFINLDKAGTITGTGLDVYYSTIKIKRLTYAKPNTISSIID